MPLPLHQGHGRIFTKTYSRRRVGRVGVGTLTLDRKDVDLNPGRDP